MRLAPLAAAVLAVASTLASPARADEPPASAEDAAAAKALFDDGLALMDAGKYTEACAKFAASEASVPRVTTLLNLGNCYEKTGQLASAWGIYNEALALARRSARADYEAFAQTHIAAIEPKLLRLTIVVDDRAKVDGLVVTRDGSAVSSGAWGAAVPVDPGEHRIHASAPKKKPWDGSVRVDDKTGSTSVTVPPLDDVPLPPAPSPAPPPIAQPVVIVAPPPAAAPADYWTTQRTLGVVIGGVGVAAVVTGSILGLVAKGRYDDARGECAAAPSVCPPSAVDKSNGAYSLATGATVAFIGGIAAVVGGAVVFFTAPSASVEPAPSVALSPLVAPGVVGLGARGAW